MKKWTKRAVVGLGIVTLVAGISACGHKTPEERQARFVNKIVHKLDLNETQRPYAEKLVAEFSELRTDMRQVRQQQLPKLKSLVASEHINADEINALIEAPKQVYESHKQDIVTQLVALHSVLDIEQKQELAEKIQHIQEHFDDH